MIEPLEPLESRVLLSSVILHGNRLVVHGDDGVNNDISVGFDRRQRVTVVLNGVGHAFKKGDVGGIDLVGGNLSDFLHVSEARSKFTIPTRFFGQGGNDTLVGGTEHDYFIGTTGNDTIFTGDGDDTVLGGSGNDTIVAGNNLKLIFGSRGNNTITVGSGRGYIFGGLGKNVITSGGDRFEIFGRGGDDILTGHGRDTLWGGGGHDVLHGGIEQHHGQFKDLTRLIRELMPDIPKAPTS